MVEVFWFSEQPYGHVVDEDLAPYESGRMHFPNTNFDPEKAHDLYNNYHDQYAWADEVGFDGIMTNEHHSAYWCMKPSVNIDAAVLCKVTKRVKIAMLGNGRNRHAGLHFRRQDHFRIRQGHRGGNPPRRDKPHGEPGPL